MLLLYVEIVNIFVLNSETNIFQNIKLFNKKIARSLRLLQAGAVHSIEK